jgi:3-methyladenine DNA glycosylase AlkD
LGDTLSDIKAALKKQCIENTKQKDLAKFFQAYPGGYGEGDRFLGVTVPAQRKIAGEFYRRATLRDIEALLRNPFHECRLTALFLLILQFEKSKDEKLKTEIAELYLRNLDFVNNWDLVDSSAPKILGPWLAERERDLLYDLARSGHLWKQRIAVLTTQHFIRNLDFEDTLRLSEILLNHSHDLIHKAVGWMLREIGNREPEVEIHFLKTHYRKMPRTMLRYAIEKLDESLRQDFLKGRI